jgi:Ca2+-binding EF-hand superfamily protein
MRNQTLAVVISSMLMAAASQAQPAGMTDPVSGTTPQSQTETTGSTATVDSGSTSTTTGAGATTTTETPNSSNENLSSYDANSSSTYDADQMNKSDASAMAQQRWREADTDRSGTLSKAEVQTSMPNIAANFDKMDANGDGQLSQDEMHHFKKSEKGAQWKADMKSADTDRDGSLSMAEVQSGMPDVAPHFSTIDTDKDGKLSTQELAAHQRTVRGMGADSSSMDADTSTRTSTSTSTTTTETGVDASTQYGTQPDAESTTGNDDTHGTSNQ